MITLEQVQKNVVRSKCGSAKDKNMLLNSLKYYGIVFFFIVGAAISSFVTKALNQKSIIFCAFGLLVILALMFIKSEEIKEK